MNARRSGLLWVVCWTPLSAFVCLFTFAVLAYFKVGHWPLYSRPDPSELRLPFLYAASLLAYPLSCIAVVAGLFSLMIAPARWTRSHAVVFLLGAGTWALTIPVTARLLNWLVD